MAFTMAEYDRYTNYSTDYSNITYNYTNTIIDYSECENSPMSASNAMTSSYFVGTVYSMYCPILIIAILGNGTVCFIVASTPRMQTVTNFFIANLAVGDLLMAVFGVPFTFIPLFILHYWPFGAAICPVVNYTQAVSVFVSAYTLVAISIDRYVAIMWPLKPRLTKRYATVTIGIVWLFAIVTALPIPIVSRLVQPSEWYEQCDKWVLKLSVTFINITSIITRIHLSISSYCVLHFYEIMDLPNFNDFFFHFNIKTECKTELLYNSYTVD